MDVYRSVAGAGPTIDNVREYLLTLYARAYDAIDRHLIYGGNFEEKKYTPHEIEQVARHFDRMIAIAKVVKEKKTERILSKLKTATIQHMRGRLSAKSFVRELRQLIREYGIPTAELKRIEEKVDRIETMIVERERAKAQEAERRRKAGANVVATLNRISTSLYTPPRRKDNGMKRSRYFTGLDKLVGKWTKSFWKGGRR